jgi:hypothetical protein
MRILRIGLFAVFLVYPVAFLQGRFLETFVNSYSGLGTFFFLVGSVSGLLAVGTLSYIFGYVAFLAVLASELFFNAAPTIFTSHLAIALIFAEGISSLKTYDLAARQTVRGENENVSSNLHVSFHRFRRTLLLVAVSLFALSVGYGLFPDVLPMASDIGALSMYATVGLLAIALTALYLGARD